MSVHRLTPEQERAMWDAIESGQGILCESRCLCCGRRTPNEACRACDEANFACANDADHWTERFRMEPEEVL